MSPLRVEKCHFLLFWGGANGTIKDCCEVTKQTIPVQDPVEDVSESMKGPVSLWKL